MTFLQVGALWGLHRGHPWHSRWQQEEEEEEEVEGINIVLAKATGEQAKPLTSTHQDSLGLLDKQTSR